MSSQNRAEKAAIIQKLYEMFGNYKQIVLANFTNVGSTQIHLIRKIIRSYQSQFIVSKNTLTKKILKMRTEGIEEEEFKYLEEQFGGKIPELKSLIPLLKDKIALIFTDAPLFELKSKLEANKVPTEARVGSVSPINFNVSPGPTSLDPSQINFFHALNISTKINKGQIQITKEFKVCTKGKKVKASEAALLKKLNIKPFQYGLQVTNVYDEGSILPSQILNYNSNYFLAKIGDGVKNICGLSLSTGYIIEATIPFIIQKSFMNVAALSAELGLKISELQQCESQKMEEISNNNEVNEKVKENNDVENNNDDNGSQPQQLFIDIFG